MSMLAIASRTVLPRSVVSSFTSSVRTMNSITDNVHFDTVAREWRCKWSPDNDKKSLQECQNALDAVLSQIKNVNGCKSVQRIVCGACMDFKVITALPADKFGDWEAKDFSPQADFLAALEKVNGVSMIETQTYTLMPM